MGNAVRYRCERISPNHGLMILFFLLLCTPALMSPAWAQEPSSTSSTGMEQKAVEPASGLPGLEELKARRAAVESAGDLEESIKKRILGFWDQAIRFTEAIEQTRKDVEETDARIKSAPDRIKDIQVRLRLPAPSTESIQNQASAMETNQIEVKLGEEEAILANLKNKLAGWKDQLEKAGSRNQVMAQETARTGKRIEEIKETLKAPPAPEEPNALIEARRAALLAEQAKCQEDIRAWERLGVGSEILLSLITSERDLASREVSLQESLIKAWSGALQTRRQKEAIQARAVAELAKQQATGYPPAVQRQLENNVRWGQDLEKLTHREAILDQTLKSVQDTLKGLEEEYALAQERVQNVVLTEATGLALREQRRNLPATHTFRVESEKRQLEMSEVREAQFELDRERQALTDPEASVERVMQNISMTSPEGLEKLKKEVRRLMLDRQDLLDKLQAAYRRYFKKLQEMEFSAQRLAVRAAEFADFLDAHLLWIRSSKAVGLEDLIGVAESITIWLNPLNWWKTLKDLWQSMQRRLGWWVPGLFLWLLLISGRSWFKRRLVEAAAGVGTIQADHISLTLRALVMTVFLAIRWPLVMVFLGWSLKSFTFAADFSRAVGSGLIAVALLLATIRLFYHICRSQGLAQIHFGWSREIIQAWRFHLLWLMPIIIPLWFLVVATEVLENPIYRDTLGRFSFISAMLVYSVFMGWVLRTKGGIMIAHSRNHGSGWFQRLRFLWYPLALGAPLILAVLAAVGYYYTALVLVDRFHATIGLIVVLILVHEISLRAMLITKRRLVFEENRRKWLEEQARHFGDLVDGKDSDREVEKIEEPRIDLEEVDEQTRSMLRTFVFFIAFFGLWAVWSQVLPVLQMMETIHLWSYKAEVDGVVVKSMPITLSSLIVAVMAAAVTMVSARNLPGGPGDSVS